MMTVAVGKVTCIKVRCCEKSCTLGAYKLDFPYFRQVARMRCGGWGRGCVCGKSAIKGNGKCGGDGKLRPS